MSQIKQSPTPRSISTRVPRALAFCLGLGGADLALLNVWVIPGLLTSTDISASRSLSSEVASAAGNVQSKQAAAKVAVAPPESQPLAAKPSALQPPMPTPPPANVVPPQDAAALAPERIDHIVPGQPTEEDWQAPPRGTVPFSLGNTAIGPQGREAVAALLEDVRAGKQFVLLAGHADPPGTERFNKHLSEQRAQAVADLLIDAGLSRSRIRTRGYGESHPSPDGHDRRVEIRLGGGQ